MAATQLLSSSGCVPHGCHPRWLVTQGFPARRCFFHRDICQLRRSHMRFMIVYDMRVETQGVSKVKFNCTFWIIDQQPPVSRTSKKKVMSAAWITTWFLMNIWDWICSWYLIIVSNRWGFLRFLHIKTYIVKWCAMLKQLSTWHTRDSRDHTSGDFHQQQTHPPTGTAGPLKALTARGMPWCWC